MHGNPDPRFVICRFTSFHLSCPMITAVSVELKTPRVPSRACHGEVQHNEAKMRTPLSGLLARMTPVTPLSPHTTSCSTNNLPGDTQQQQQKADSHSSNMRLNIEPGFFEAKRAPQENKIQSLWVFFFSHADSRRQLHTVITRKLLPHF